MADYKEFIDEASGLGRLMNNQSLYNRLLSSFNGEEIADEIKAFIESGNYTEAAASAHKIKGVSANLSLLKLQEASLNLEMALKSDSPPSSLSEEYYAVVRNTKAAIDAYISK